MLIPLGQAIGPLTVLKQEIGAPCEQGRIELKALTPELRHAGAQRSARSA